MLAHLAAYDGRLYIYETLDIPLDHYPFPIDVDLTDGIYRPGALMALPLTFSRKSRTVFYKVYQDHHSYQNMRVVLGLHYYNFKN
jgi:hypothetical protein